MSHGESLQVALQNLPRVTPTLLHSFAAASFQSAPIGLSALTVVLRNPAACLRVGVWDKTWDNAENFSAAEGPQFRFCPWDKNERTPEP